MADSTVLKMKFDTMSGSKTWTYKQANEDATKSNVMTLAATMIANGTIYQNQPVRLTEAKIVTTTERTYDLSS